ncbi:MAG: hypothetical protein E6943_09750 [Actinomyces sp.]|nr:hypothetical protein [Actinomyces sp.]
MAHRVARRALRSDFRARRGRPAAHIAATPMVLADGGALSIGITHHN